MRTTTGRPTAGNRGVLVRRGVREYRVRDGGARPSCCHERGRTVAGFEAQAALSKAREAASLASYDIQKLREDSVEKQALHNLLTAVDALITAVDAGSDADAG